MRQRIVHNEEISECAKEILEIVETESRFNALTKYSVKGKGKEEASQTDRLRYIAGGLIMLKVQTRNLGNVSVLRLDGRIVNGETASVREAVCSQSRVGAVVLDLAGVSVIDASGLGLLLELRREMQSQGARLKLMNASQLVRRVFEITRLDSVFEVTAGVPAISPRPSRKMPLARCA